MTRAAPPKWSVRVPVRARAMVLAPPAAGAAAGRLIFAGPPDSIDSKDPLASFEGRAGALLWSVSTADGTRKAQYRLDAPPAFAKTDPAMRFAFDQRRIGLAFNGEYEIIARVRPARLGQSSGKSPPARDDPELRRHAPFWVGRSTGLSRP